MATALVLLSLLFLVTLFWLDSARARELATGLAKKLCERRGLQLLDDTVVLRRIGLRWEKEGIRFRRMFSFDFSRGDGGRRSAYLILLGTRVEQYDLGLPSTNQEKPDAPKAETAAPGTSDGKDAEGGDNKVVPFRRPPRK